jgi:TonB family protein
MKNICFCILGFLLAFSTISQAQKLRTLYYTSQWELTTEDSAKYYRTALIDTIKNQFVGMVKDFTMKDQLLMSGVYQHGVKNGIFTFYYPTGQIEAQGEFKNDKRSGLWNYFYTDGRAWREVKFTEDDFFVVSLHDIDGKLLIKDGTGEWSYTYEWHQLAQSLTIRGTFLDGKKEDEWVCGYTNGDVLYKEVFKKGKFRKGNYTNPNGSVKEEYKEEFPNKFLPPYKLDVTEKFLYIKGLTQNNYPFLTFLPGRWKRISIASQQGSLGDTLNGKVFLVVEQPPEFEGGNEAMHKFVAKNIQYPASARKMNIQGTVFISFVINVDGSISEASIIKGISADCDREALRVINMMPNWRPGMQSGKAVRVKFVYPIKFKLGR